MFCVCLAFASVHCCLVVTWRERADLLALVFDVYFDLLAFPFCILEQVWYLIVSVPDHCCISYFKLEPSWSLKSNPQRAIKEETRVANRDLVDHQT